jgi:hypothetical protein
LHPNANETETPLARHAADLLRTPRHLSHSGSNCFIVNTRVVSPHHSHRTTARLGQVIYVGDLSTHSSLRRSGCGWPRKLQDEYREPFLFGIRIFNTTVGTSFTTLPGWVEPRALLIRSADWIDGQEAMIRTFVVLYYPDLGTHHMYLASCP